MKVHAFSGFWDALQTKTVEVLQEGKVFVNASKAYSEVVIRSATQEVLDGIVETTMNHPTDSHPPLGVRLASLGITLNDVSAASLAVSPTDPAIDLITEPEGKEEEISQTFQTILAQRIGIDLSEF